MKKLILYTLILFLMSCRSTQEVDTSVYMDAKQPVDKRVEALLAQMTLEEKVGQMDMVTVWDKEAIFKNGYYDFGAWLADLEPEECNQLQKLSRTNPSEDSLSYRHGRGTWICNAYGQNNFPDFHKHGRYFQPGINLSHDFEGR